MGLLVAIAGIYNWMDIFILELRLTDACMCFKSTSRNQVHTSSFLSVTCSFDLLLDNLMTRDALKMPSVGPQLPPQLDKRKRERASDSESESEDEYGPSAPNLPQKRRSPSPESVPKKARTIGPTLPPASLDEKPPQPAEEQEDSSDDDGYGPALPTASDEKRSYQEEVHSKAPAAASGPQITSKVTRDEWMIVPPSSGDWSSRVDPTKLKNRTFNTGKSAKGPAQAGGGDMAKWMETPAEKAARLQREMLGIQDTSAPKSEPRRNDAHSEATARRLKEFNVSLFSTQQICQILIFSVPGQGER